jgi:CRP-like cAMP-binding protein
MSDNYAEMMTRFPLFKGFTANGAQRLLAAGEIQHRTPGEVLLKEGDQADFVLLVLSGQLEVFVDRDGQHLTLTEAEPGDILGELAVLCGIPRSASVKAKGDAAVLKWTEDAFRTLLLRDPSLSQRIFREALRTLVEKERSLIDSVIDAQEEASKSYSADN